MTVDWRSEWFDISDATYLNFAAHSLLPRVAAEAAQRAIGAKARPHRSTDAAFFESAERARGRLASILGAQPDDIALLTGAGGGAAIVASAMDWRSGDDVLLARGDFPVQLATWQPLEARYGVRVRRVEPSGPFLCADDLIGALSERTRVVSVSHVRFDDGSLLDVEPLAAACRARGVVLVLDVSQSCGAMPIDVATLGADVLVGAGYKYLLGPWGTGFLWIRRELLEALRPSPYNWIAQGVNRFSALSFADPRPAAGASRFDASEWASPYNFNLAALAAALELVVRAEPAVVLAHCQALIERLYAGLPAPCAPASPLSHTRRGAFGCFTAGSLDDSVALFERLRSEDVVVAIREGRIRVAPHLYNTTDDIDRVLTVASDWAREQRS